ncbi:MAG TPA: hypothetical protein ENK66_04250 [Arcobacter sp.]|nr:hypothetical protein [Arcobacter sp.]
MKINYDQAEEVVKQASMQEQPKRKKILGKKKQGRPTKDKEPASEKIMVNVTPTQKEKIKNYVEKNHLTTAGLIKSLLAKENII